MKRIISLVLSIIISFYLVACQNKDTSSLPYSEDTTSDSEVLSTNSNTPDEYFFRLFDAVDMKQKCEKLLPLFAPCSINSWNSNNTDGLLNIYFKWYVERLYYTDTGLEFVHDENGYTHINNYITYGQKYFDLSEQQIRDYLSANQYNAENDTVFMSDGLGCSLGTAMIDVTERVHDNTVYYDIDYIVTEPESTQFKYSCITFTMNNDGSFKFISNHHYDTQYIPSYDIKSYLSSEPIAVSKDNSRSLYRGKILELNNTTASEIILKDNTSTACVSLGFTIDSLVSDAGFFSNGDAFTMDYNGLNVYNFPDGKDSSNPLIFTTHTNFPAGPVKGIGIVDRYIFAVRRDPEKMDYIVIYSECDTYNPADKFQLKQNYKAGLLDADGNLVQSWDTGVPVIYSSFGFEPVYMSKPSENEIEFFVKYKGCERLRGRFNLENGAYTPVNTFSQPYNENIETVKYLADKQLGPLSLFMSYDWNENSTNLDFALIAASRFLYQYETGENLPYFTTDDMPIWAIEAIKLSDLMPVISKYFSFDTDAITQHLRSYDSYDAETDSVLFGDGWGWLFYPEVTDVIYNGSEYVIHYNLIEPYGEIVCENIITAQLADEGYLKFISNQNNYV